MECEPPSLIPAVLPLYQWRARPQRELTKPSHRGSTPTPPTKPKADDELSLSVLRAPTSPARAATESVLLPLQRRQGQQSATPLMAPRGVLWVGASRRTSYSAPPAPRTGCARGRGGRAPWCAAGPGSLDDRRPAAWCGRSPSGPAASCARRSAGRWRRGARDRWHPLLGPDARGVGGDRRRRSRGSGACRNRHRRRSGAAGSRL